MRTGSDGGGDQPGGLKGYPLERLYEELAFLAYHLHWGYQELLELDHAERRRWCREISRINQRLAEEERRRG
ncbi:MAG TPA: hypothetical protein ENJ40_00380 [Thermosulfurimonas dismutans]|uniref:DUF6760 domain-containing protein n=1 Tax=Thermosulfurimonas dismutans TaxID=999894 RepID=A0A7C3GPY4_9BACT|nr:DUF6760 family protein [Thermosulfurimonas sp.]HFC96900.1 hypothetical protein [Thermosulfurimonas dismutans]